MTSGLRSTVTTSLFLAVALLAVATWHEATKHIDISPIRPPTPPGGVPSGATTVISETIVLPEAAAELRNRPLFNEGRRPLPQAATSAQVEDKDNGPQTQSGDLTVVGTLRWGNRHLALIRAASDPLARWISVGGNVNGWILRGIEADFIVVERASRKVQLPIVSKDQPTSESAGD